MSLPFTATVWNVATYIADPEPLQVICFLSRFQLDNAELIVNNILSVQMYIAGTCLYRLWKQNDMTLYRTSLWCLAVHLYCHRWQMAFYRMHSVEATHREFLFWGLSGYNTRGRCIGVWLNSHRITNVWIAISDKRNVHKVITYRALLQMYSRQTMRWSLRGVNILSAVRGGVQSMQVDRRLPIG
jgi:hypothetical protein